MGQIVEETVQPPFPDKMTFKEMLEGLFNLDFMTQGEQQTIFDAGEMYANGCLKLATKCDAMGHYGGDKPDDICPKCGKEW